MKGIAISLGLPPDHFESGITKDPFILFRIFHYPATLRGQDERWGVGEHTDYGLITILKQDEVGGLQIRSNGHWMDAPPVPNSFICNIGDMLDRMTNGLYLSTPHRVRNSSGRNRLSFPLFFDPNFDAVVNHIPCTENARSEASDRWDDADVYSFDGTYGDYLINKVSKVFPQLSNKL
jgi:isopenicillin N synthase-like dioxygenase